MDTDKFIQDTRLYLLRRHIFNRVVTPPPSTTLLKVFGRAMKYLIVGGCGFIGTNFCRLLLEHEAQFRILDSLTYASNRLTCGFGEKFYQVDIRDAKKVEKVFKEYQPDVVVHFAAESHVDRSIKDPNIFVETNVLGTVNLLNACRKYPVKKFIYISTDEVYGSLDRGFAKETDLVKPSSPYSASKASGELFCQAYFVTFGVPIIITRSTNNYGPEQSIEKFIPRAITNVLTKQKIKVYGKGKQKRDWIYVKDNCEAVLKVIEKGKIGEIYNIGVMDSSVTNLDIAKLLGHDDEIEYVKDRPGHDFRYAVDTKKMRRLGWKPKISLTQGLYQTIMWYRVNQKIWLNIKETIERLYK